MNLPRLAVQRPVTTFMILVSIMVIGGIALARLPLAFLPNIDVPFIVVNVPYPNSNPSQIEKEIAKPVEEVLATLPGMKHLNSRSSADNVFFFLEFNWGDDLDIVRMQVSEKMDQVRRSLPEGIGEVVILSFNTTDMPVVMARISAKGVDLSENYELLETRILNRLRRVPGVAKVEIEGVLPKEISIDLILDKIKEHRVDVQALIQKLQGASSNLVLGQVSQGGLRYTARALGQFESLDAIRNMAINERGLRLSEIAEIVYEEPPIPHGRHLDKEFAIALQVFKESTANTVEVVRATMKVIEEDIGADPLLQGINVFVWQDQADEITSSIDGLKRSGLIGAFLAIIVLYFFLRRFDSTLIVSFSIPFSLIAACGILYFLGKSLNILTMMGLMIGVGMLVDNAIVVLESIDRRHRNEPDTRKAALEGARSVMTAVVSSTLTTLIVFLPVIVGAKSALSIWLGEVGLTISIALICSLFSSLTLIPLMSGRFLRRKQTAESRPIGWMEDRYVGLLAWTMRHKGWMAIIVLAGLMLGIVPFAAGLIDSSMFAAGRNRRLTLRYDFSDFVYKSDAERAVDQVEDYLLANKAELNIESVYSIYEENRADTTITMADKSLNDRELRELRKQIREDLPEVPGARIFFHEDADEGGDSTYFAVKFFGQDSNVLRDIAEEAERRLGTVGDVLDISTSLNRGRKEIQVVIDRDKALRRGLTAEDVSNIFSFTLGGMRLQRFNTGSREVETWLALRLEDRQNLADLKQLQIGTPDGPPIQLSDIASFQVVRRPEEILREDRKIRVSVNATYEGESWDDAKEEIEGLMNAFDLPPGYAWSWNDRILEQSEENRQMGINFLLALMLVYIVMAALFESLTQPFAILFSIPLAMPGVFWVLAATRTPFNIMAMIGLIILIGIVVNNGIVLLDHLNQLRRAGVRREEAILQAGRDRLRPILMTATTTTVGLLPLAIGSSGVGGAYYYPMARTIIGGLLCSTILTLIVLPYINLMVEDVANWMGRVWRRSRLAATKPSADEIPALTGGSGGLITPRS
ncbi:MAG: efflux RND transporter permease subunit [Acidobacteria bacterium]|nr:efflux RND transporter permease subunit [Acidobacteriota bacterium]